MLVSDVYVDPVWEFTIGDEVSGLEIVGARMC